MIMDTRDDNRKVAVNLRDVPADLRNRFKSWCARNEQTMTGAILAYMQRVVDGPEKPRKSA